MCRNGWFMIAAIRQFHVLTRFRDHGDQNQPCGGSASGLPECSEMSQQALNFTRIFTSYTG